jgi:hypothetical protein
MTLFDVHHDFNDNRPLLEKAEKQVLNLEALHVLWLCSLSNCESGFERF